MDLDLPDTSPAAHRDSGPSPAPPLVNREIRCLRCDGPLKGLSFDAECSSCGTPVRESIRAHHAEDADSSLTLLFGTLSLIAPGLSLFLAPVAIIFFVRTLRSHRSGVASDRAMTLAGAGLIMAIIALLLVPVLAMILLSLALGSGGP